MTMESTRCDPVGESQGTMGFQTPVDYRFVTRCSLLFVGVFIYITYAFLDTLTANPNNGQFTALRFGIVSPLLLLTAVGYAKKRVFYRDSFVSLAWAAIGIASILYITAVTADTELTLYIPDATVIFFGIWMFLLPPFRQTLMMAAFLMLSLAFVIVTQEVSPVAHYTKLYFAVTSCTALVIGSLFLQNIERNDRSYRQQLEESIRTLRESEQRAVELYREAKQAEKAKNEFLAVVSHELRTPMNAIIGFSDIISTEMMGRLDPPQYRDYAVHINDSGKQLLKVINDILDISRAEIDKISFEMREFDISATVDSALTACRANADEADVSVIRARPCLRDLTILGDESRLLQAMTNIIGNAIKFSDRNGTITVDLVLKPGGDLHFVTRDEGIGISDADICNIKQPFRQAEGAFIRNNGGLGLGLAICDIVTTAHEGDLLIESTPGEGTTVSIVLPASCVVKASQATTAA